MIEQEAIRDIVANIWGSMLDLPLDASPGADATDYLTGCVQITGDWQGAVLIELSGGLSRRVASVLFAMDPSEIGEGEVNDAVGELANMIGGNVKSLLEGSCHLSLPAVVQGRHYTLSVSKGQLTGRCDLSCEGEPVVVSVFRRAEA